MSSDEEYLDSLLKSMQQAEEASAEQTQVSGRDRLAALQATMNRGEEEEASAPATDEASPSAPISQENTSNQPDEETGSMEETVDLAAMLDKITSEPLPEEIAAQVEEAPAEEPVPDVSELEDLLAGLDIPAEEAVAEESTVEIPSEEPVPDASEPIIDDGMISMTDEAASQTDISLDVLRMSEGTAVEEAPQEETVSVADAPVEEMPDLAAMLDNLGAAEIDAPSHDAEMSATEDALPPSAEEQLMDLGIDLATQEEIEDIPASEEDRSLEDLLAGIDLPAEETVAQEPAEEEIPDTSELGDILAGLDLPAEEAVPEAIPRDIPTEEIPPAEVPPSLDSYMTSADAIMASLDELPAEEAPVEEPAGDDLLASLGIDLPAEEVPAEEAPAEEMPGEDIPVAEEEPVAEEAPVEEPAGDDLLASLGIELPAEEVPAEEAPVAEEPAEEVPADESSSEDEMPDISDLLASFSGGDEEVPASEEGSGEGDAGTEDLLASLGMDLGSEEAPAEENASDEESLSEPIDVTASLDDLLSTMPDEEAAPATIEVGSVVDIPEMNTEGDLTAEELAGDPMLEAIGDLLDKNDNAIDVEPDEENEEVRGAMTPEEEPEEGGRKKKKKKKEKKDKKESFLGKLFGKKKGEDTSSDEALAADAAASEEGVGEVQPDLASTTADGEDLSNLLSAVAEATSGSDVSDDDANAAAELLSAFATGEEAPIPDSIEGAMTPDELLAAASSAAMGDGEGSDDLSDALSLLDALGDGGDIPMPDMDLPPEEGSEGSEEKKEIDTSKLTLGQKIKLFLFGEDEEEETPAAPAAEGEGGEGEGGENAEEAPAKGKKGKKAKKDKKKKGKKGAGDSDQLASVTDENAEIMKEMDAEEEEGGKKGKKGKKPKKEKKPKEPKEEKPKEPPMKIPKKNIIMTAIFMVTIILSVAVICKVVPGVIQAGQARSAYYDKDYETSYQLFYGQDLSESDQLIFKRSELILQMQHRLEVYENYEKIGKPLQALDSLMMGAARYDELTQQAVEYNITAEMEEIYRQILDVLESRFGLSEEEVREINGYESDYLYSLRLESIVNQTPFVNPYERPVDPTPQDIIPGEEELLGDELQGDDAPDMPDGADAQNAPEMPEPADGETAPELQDPVPGENGDN